MTRGEPASFVVEEVGAAKCSAAFADELTVGNDEFVLTGFDGVEHEGKELDTLFRCGECK